MFLWLYSKRLLVCLEAERSLCTRQGSGTRLESEKNLVSNHWLALAYDGLECRLKMVESLVGWPLLNQKLVPRHSSKHL